MVRKEPRARPSLLKVKVFPPIEMKKPVFFQGGVFSRVFQGGKGVL